MIYFREISRANNYSTDQAILSIIDQIQRGIDDKDFSCGIFLDFRKVSDTVNHMILFEKLQHNGIRGGGVARSWFKSYLYHCQQIVTINNTSADPLLICCGIP